MSTMNDWLETLETLRMEIARSYPLDASQKERLQLFVSRLAKEVEGSRSQGAPGSLTLIERVSRQYCMQQCADAIRKAEKNAGTTDSSVIITNEYLNIAEMWRKLAALAGEK